MWKYVNFMYKNNMIYSFDFTNSVDLSNGSKLYYYFFKENEWTLNILVVVFIIINELLLHRHWYELYIYFYILILWVGTLALLVLEALH